MNTRNGAVYARISKADRKVPKTEIQVQICLALADDDGVTVDPQHIFIDDGIAASGREIDDTTLENRPAARRLLDAAKAGAFDVLYAVEGERLARTYLDGIKFIQASAQGGVTWHLDTDGILDPSTPAGEETAVSIFASGRREGRVRTARQKRRYDRERAAGMPLWGPRPFGYEDDRITVRESEALLIRNAVRDVLSGERSMSQIVSAWNAANVQTDGMKRERMGRDGVRKPARGYWTVTTVRQLLLRDRNAGIFTHNGAELPNSQIQPIITRAELEAMKARIQMGTPVTSRARSLLGGIIRCECGAPMHSTMSYSQRKGGPRREYMIYKCSETLYDKTRRHASVQTHIAEKAVQVGVLRALALGEVQEDEAPAYGVRLAEIAERLTVLGEQEARIEDALIEGLGDAKRLKGRLETIRTERAELRDEQARAEADRVGGNVFRVIAQLRDVLDDALTIPGPLFEDETEALEKLLEAWGDVPVEDFQALVRGRFAVAVKVGGRGGSRVSVAPR